MTILGKSWPVFLLISVILLFITILYFEIFTAKHVKNIINYPSWLALLYLFSVIFFALGLVAYLVNFYLTNKDPIAIKIEKCKPCDQSVLPLPKSPLVLKNNEQCHMKWLKDDNKVKNNIYKKTISISDLNEMLTDSA
jgi:hypothetical protein